MLLDLMEGECLKSADTIIVRVKEEKRRPPPRKTLVVGFNFWIHFFGENIMEKAW